MNASKAVGEQPNAAVFCEPRDFEAAEYPDIIPTESGHYPEYLDIIPLVTRP